VVATGGFGGFDGPGKYPLLDGGVADAERCGGFAWLQQHVGGFGDLILDGQRVRDLSEGEVYLFGLGWNTFQFLTKIVLNRV